MRGLEQNRIIDDPRATPMSTSDGARSDGARSNGARTMSSATFALDPRLAADTHRVGDLALSRVLLFDDTRFPWLILVPRQPGLRDLIDLAHDEQHQLLDEINRC